MSDHLNEEQLIGYTHNTLTDAEREAIDRHLTTCPQDRARLAQVEDAGRQIRNGLIAEMNLIQPPDGISFASIAGRVKATNPVVSIWQRSAPFVSAALALVGVIVAFGGNVGAGIWDSTILALKEVDQVQSIAEHVRYPTLACFLLAIPIAANRGYTQILRPAKIVNGTLTFLLWLGSAVIALYEIYLLQGVVIYLAILFPALRWLTALVAFTPFFLGMVWIALVIGGGEFHYHNYGTRASWKLFAWTIGIEMLILPLTLLV